MGTFLSTVKRRTMKLDREYGSVSSEVILLSSPGMVRKALLGVLIVLLAVAGIAMSLHFTQKAELFSLSADEAHVDDDAALNLALKGKQSTAAARHDSLANSVMLSRVNQDELSAEALLATDKPRQTQSLYSGIHDSGDPLGFHTGHLGTADGLADLSSFQNLNIGDGINFGNEQDQVTDTQLSGLKDEFSTLKNHRQDIIDSLTLQRQSTAAKAAHDEAHADVLRLHRAVSKAAARNLRLALKAARLARQRAAEARAIRENELAIAKVQRSRAEALESGRRAAMRDAAQAESNMRAQAEAIRTYRSQQYHNAMHQYGSQLQQYVAKDMQLLGELKAAEDSASVEPHLESSVWSQPPTPENLPVVDPALFENNAPFRDEGSLANFKQVQGSTELSESSADTMIDRVMKREQKELRQLNTIDVKRTKTVHRARGSLKLDTSVATSLSDYTSNSRGDGMSTAQPVLSSDTVAALRSLKDIDDEANKLGDGDLIRHPKQPVALVRIPLGAHEDAKKGARRHVQPPKATIIDQSTEATAIRADGSHRYSGSRLDEASFGRRIRHASNLPVKVHMPHVI